MTFLLVIGGLCGLGYLAKKALGTSEEPGLLVRALGRWMKK
ncbi:unnamed protein product [Gemmata massiliana]|uniref:Uncharacterized protein n=1 Tax=Gemmata massiliana TaxID=1210884 RepID=A0A6P2DF83_9BACT|nr:hypothetical protein [Gemmata massiliana]VTS00390.1 unnamed protein product [Gemmata massiliana]